MAAITSFIVKVIEGFKMALDDSGNKLDINDEGDHLVF